MNKGKTFKSTDAARLTDEATRELLFRLLQYVERNDLLSFGFRFMEVSLADAATHTVPHTLGFVPKDLILTGKSGAGNATFNYDSFTKTTLSITTTGTCVLRLLVGTYRSE